MTAMASSDLQRARARLSEGGVTCVLCHGDELEAAEERGVKPLLVFLSGGRDFSEFSAADKVVGKAAAYLYVLLGIKTLYAGVISSAAAEVCSRFGISVEYGVLTDGIINRAGTGPCPMEQAVDDIDDPYEALKAIKKKAEELNRA